MPKSEDHDERERIGGAGEHERVAHDRIVQLVDQEVQRDAREDRDDRQHQEAEHRERGDEHRHAEGGAAQAAHVTSHPSEKTSASRQNLGVGDDSRPVRALVTARLVTAHGRIRRP